MTQGIFALPRQQWLRERVTRLHYAYIACLVYFLQSAITWLTKILIFWDVTHFAAFSNVPTNSGADESFPNHWGRKHNVRSKRRYLAPLLSLLVDWVRVVVNCAASPLYSWGRNSFNERLCGLHNRSGHSEEQKGPILVPGVILGSSDLQSLAISSFAWRTMEVKKAPAEISIKYF